jgi:hypothetical protein
LVDDLNDLWLSVSKLAARDGVTVQAVSKHVARLEGLGLEVRHDARGRVAAINVASYDALRGRVGDPSKSQAPRRDRPKESSSTNLPEIDPNSYEESLRRKTLYEAERARLKFEQEAGELVIFSEVVAATTTCGETIVGVLELLPTCADEIALAVVESGANGARAVLKREVRELRIKITEAFRAIAKEKVCE